MYKQDVLASNPDSQTFVRSDNETASVNLMDPQLVNLYSNLDQLVNLKNYKSGKLSNILLKTLVSWIILELGLYNQKNKFVFCLSTLLNYLLKPP
jgi:hypothetical protein